MSEEKIERLVIDLEQNDCSKCPYKKPAEEAIDRTKGYYYCDKYDKTIGLIYSECDVESVAKEILEKGE